MVEPGSAKQRSLVDSARLDAAHEPNEDGGARNSLFRTTYLDALPKDVLAGVLRHLSARPMHARWQVYVSPSEVALGCGKGHPLCSTIRTIMTTMHAHYSRKLPPGVEAVGMQLDLIENESLLNELLAHRGRICAS